MIYKTEEKIIHTKEVPLSDGTSFPVLCFEAWEKLDGIRHCFTTRAGGVSEGFLESLNFRRDSYDTSENIRENYRRAAAFFGVPVDRIVCANQTHTANVRIVTGADAGKGVTRERDYTDVDGLITDVPGLVLFTSHADCVPLYFYDPVRRVIALSHSGWKGTVSRIGEVTVRKMEELYGCDPRNIHAAVGPSICRDCYEVSEDVAEPFVKCFPPAAPAVKPAATQAAAPAVKPAATQAAAPAVEPAAGWRHDSDAAQQFADCFPAESAACQKDAEDREVIPRILYRGRMPGKYQLDLWQANARILREAGISEEHLAITNLCTCENAGELFSHRATAGKRGNQGAFLMLC